MPDPNGIVIEPNVEDAKEYLYSLMGGKFTETYNEIMSELHQKQNGSIIQNNFSDAEFAKKTIDLIEEYRSNFFLLTFLCFTVSYWRQHIKKNGVNVVTIKNISELKKVPDKTLQEIVKEYLECLSSKDTEIEKNILLALKDIDREAWDFFDKLFMLSHDNNVVIKDATLSCDFKKIDNNLRKSIFGINESYSKINLERDFMSFSFYPKLSSGEMSFLTLFARIYSCLKLDARLEKKKDVIIYLDEAETTLHPEWQRLLVTNIINFLEEFVQQKKIHVIFASHSPILLSDIPDSNVVFLEKDKKTGYTRVVDHKETGKTFGANIYSLYKNSFFMDGVIGEFAENKINHIIKDLLALELDLYTEDKGKGYGEIEQEIGLIGEPVIRKQLMDRLIWVKVRKKFEK